MSSGFRTSDLVLSTAAVDEFIGNYYEHLAGDDAQGYSPEELRERAVAHLELAAVRAPGEPRVSVRNGPDSSVAYVVTDDMPFLVDSVTAAIVRDNAAIQLVLHPTFVVSRSRSDHELVKINRVPAHLSPASGDTAAMPSLSGLISSGDHESFIESWIAVEMNRLTDEAAAALEATLVRILGDVRSAVEDWQGMRRKAAEVSESLRFVPHPESVANLEEARRLLDWLDDGNFTFLGYREYDLITRDGEDMLQIRRDSGLGILRHVEEDKLVQRLTDASRAKAREKQALVITKANSRSTVHRSAYLDYIGVKNFDAEGNVSGERRFIGLFATTAYTRSVRTVPIIQEKVNAVLRACGFAPDSHSGKDLLAILETYPRDELFQISVDELVQTAMGILRLQERRRTRLFLRPDVYGRFMSALVYLPRDRYTTGVRHRIEDELRQTFDAESIDFEARMSESALVRLFFRIRLPRGSEVPQIDAAALEQRLARATRSWSEGVEQVLRANLPLEEAKRMAWLWAEAFPAAYRVDYEVEDALEDIQRFSAYSAPGREAPVLHVYVPAGDRRSRAEDARLKLYLTQPKSLSQILPVLHNLGLEVLDERPFDITRADGTSFHLYDLGLRYPAGVDPLASAGLLEEAFAAVVVGAAESDIFDRLVLREGMHWRQVLILRSYAKYMRQLGNANSYGFIADTLLANPVVSRALVSLFELTFDPALAEESRDGAKAAVRAELAEALEQVPTLDADRVLRTIANLIDASLRTNYFQRRTHVSIKLNPRMIESAPYPRPKYEIWVYSPRVEGVHLRFGEVARGGLRWSDRREDFRTEVLGLVKAQTVKNAVIVPTGAKGGFFAKQLPDPAADRAAWFAEGQAAYRTFIRGLLDITDNLVTDAAGERLVPPADVVRLDGDDAYLVVAADKGTATFSDIANEISAEYSHWLGDAFASGGSIGYDHKAMGITARGAWESVKRHFSELDVDTQQEDFTVAGVGDMSGDVFGNGMLLSRHILLVAAFDHRHIFLDPNPDAEASFEERRRLFELPRSSWQDYNPDLISAGGGIYPRHAKTVPVSGQVREVLGLDEGVTELAPPELLRAILKAPVDLLYNGGIGTYVKAATETHASVGDKANDAIRINGGEVRARVIGEGGNLGMTQLGRIEAALNGVLLNTDAIDNSAGVDCSDHEVNIKIFVDRMVAAGKMSAEERAPFLHSMTDEVGRLVLQDNIDQNILLLNDKQRILEWTPSFERLMSWLEKNADLDRRLEFLPSTAELKARTEKGQSLTTPELSVLAAYAKIQLSKALTESNLADDPYFARTLRRYFPRQLVERFDAELDSHPLRREIIATVMANDVINMGGITFLYRVIEETAAAEASIVRSFAALREIFQFDVFAQAVEELPASFPTDRWCQIQLDMRRLLDRSIRWFVNHVALGSSVEEDIAAFKPIMEPLRRELHGLLKGADLERVEAWKQEGLSWGLPEPLAELWSEEFESFPLLDVSLLARRLDEPAQTIAAVYFTIYDRLRIDDLLERITHLPREDRWQALARAALRDDLYATAADMTVAVIEGTGTELEPLERVLEWERLNVEQLGRAKNMFAEVNQLEHDDMASLSVALRHLRSIVRR